MDNSCGAAGPQSSTAGLTREEARPGASLELVRVPGSGATTVDPAALWKALPRLLLSCDNAFAQFFSSYFEYAHDCPEVGRAALSPWPMPLPYFGASEVRKNQGCCASDARQEDALKVALNLLVAALSWLHLGRSRSAPSLIRGRRALDDEQWAHVGRLEGMVREIICHSPVSAEEMGRVASKIENLEEIAEGLRNKTEKLAVLCRGSR